MALSAQDLYEQTDEKVITETVRTFTKWMTVAPEVAPIFRHPGDPLSGEFAPVISEIAIGLVAASVANSALYGFANTIDAGAAERHWQQQMNSPEARDCGQTFYKAAFAQFCTSPSGTTFGDYLKQEPPTAAQELADYVKAPAFINVEMAKLIAGEPDWLRRLNLVFYKLGELDTDETLITEVLGAWRSAYPNHGIVINFFQERFVTVASYSATHFIGEVNAAIGQSSQQTVQLPPFGPPGHQSDGGQALNTVMGADVQAFVNGPAKDRGLATGTQPNNIVDSEPIPDDQHGSGRGH